MAVDDLRGRAGHDRLGFCAKRKLARQLHCAVLLLHRMAFARRGAGLLDNAFARALSIEANPPGRPAANGDIDRPGEALERDPRL
jgi:hypothetical protein